MKINIGDIELELGQLVRDEAWIKHLVTVHIGPSRYMGLVESPGVLGTLTPGTGFDLYKVVMVVTQLAAGPGGQIAQMSFVALCDGSGGPLELMEVVRHDAVVRASEQSEKWRAWAVPLYLQWVDPPKIERPPVRS